MQIPDQSEMMKNPRLRYDVLQHHDKWWNDFKVWYQHPHQFGLAIPSLTQGWDKWWNGVEVQLFDDYQALRDAITKVTNERNAYRRTLSA